MNTLGLMSGTSADGIDIVLLNDDPLELLAFDFYPFKADLKKRILAAIQGQALNALAWAELDAALGAAYSDAVKYFLKKQKIPKETIAAIGLHGQTVAHIPQSKPANTIQLGHPAWLAAQTGIPVIADFRSMDMAYGGQGAPLAPGLHRYLFKTQTAVLNLGGIANLTILNNDRVVGFDLGPANCLMDEWIHIHKNFDYDENGQWAATGTINKILLKKMLSEPYFQQDIPKSTGRELFNQTWLASCLDNKILAPEDVQRTLLELVVQTVKHALDLYGQESQHLIIVGGGVHNDYLLQCLNDTLLCKVQSSADYGINPDYVEAMLMAWLAARHVQQKKTDMRAITGCKVPLIYGISFSPCLD